MLTLLAVVHVILGLSLILFVLLQDPKGGAMGVFSGGSSSSSFFGASGASNFLSTTTKWLATLFAISCLTLTYKTANRGGSVMDQIATPAAVPGAPTPEGSATTAPAAAPTMPGAGQTAPAAPTAPTPSPATETPTK